MAMKNVSQLLHVEGFNDALHSICQVKTCRIFFSRFIAGFDFYDGLLRYSYLKDMFLLVSPLYSCLK